jgi:site-specific DNA-methyltransferase (adenine-specific)
VSESFLNGKIELHCGDMLAVLPTLAENSIDSVVCDPPYHLTSIVKRFGASESKPPLSAMQRRFAKTGAAMSLDPDGQPTPDQYGRLSRGFMGKVWDGGDMAFRPETWAQVWRVMKPGAHLIAFSGTRTYHRMACAIEDAGFEIRDQIGWAFGSGFPKSHDVSKGIDKAAGEHRERIRDVRSGVVNSVYAQDAWSKEFKDSVLSSEPITGAAREWDGWGTALKPAWEPIVLARKPLEGTVAANVLKWGTGAVNIDACRVASFAGSFEDSRETKHNDVYGKFNPSDYDGSKGRWPANIIHDGSDEVLEAFPETDAARVGNRGLDTGIQGGRFAAGERAEQWTDKISGHDDGGGSAARFFYAAKADSDDRLGSKHPTVKPLDLIQYLVRLVTPANGLVLDCFAGTGTTGEAAWREGKRAILIEREAEYQADIRRRMALALSGPDERAREAIKAKMNGKPQDHGPLFGGAPKDERGGAGRYTESSRTNDWPGRIEMVTE